MLKLFNDSNIKIGIPKKKLKEIEKFFKELRHNVSKKEINKFRKSFYNIKNHGNIYASKIKEAEKNLSKLEKSIKFIKSSSNNNNNESIVDIKRLLDCLNQKRLLILIIIRKAALISEYCFIISNEKD